MFSQKEKNQKKSIAVVINQPLRKWLKLTIKEASFIFGLSLKTKEFLKTTKFNSIENILVHSREDLTENGIMYTLPGKRQKNYLKATPAIMKDIDLMLERMGLSLKGE